MGIRFYCPNGHKLNVKVFQAGRKGICPRCGAGVEIPHESTRPSSKESKQPQRGEAPPAAAATELQTAAVSTPPASATPPADPLQEAGDAAWYVRPSAGGQFGPAGSGVMRTWIDEGRVAADSLIWRAGWQDWQEASTVFQGLSDSGGVFPAPEPNGPQPFIREAPDAPRLAVPRRSKQAPVRLILVLAVVVLILFGVLIWVLLRDPGAASEEAAMAAPAAGRLDRTAWPAAPTVSVRPLQACL